MANWDVMRLRTSLAPTTGNIFLFLQRALAKLLCVTITWKQLLIIKITFHLFCTYLMGLCTSMNCRISVAVPWAYLAMFSLWLVRQGIKWTDTAYHCLGMQQRPRALLVGIMIAKSSNWFIRPGRMTSIPEGDSIIKETLHTLLNKYIYW